MQMVSTPSYVSKQIGFSQRYGIGQLSSIYIKNFSKSLSTAEVKVLAAKKHSESERRRRMRINSQYAVLRKILPNLIKMDKASVLAETVRQVRELQKEVAEIEASCRGNGSESVIPSGVNKLSLEKCKGKEEGLVKATVSCEDRSGLISDMTRELRSGKGRVVRAEMVTVGGRTKSVLWVEGLGAGSEDIVLLKKALNKVIVDRPSNSYIFPSDFDRGFATLTANPKDKL
ncbi:transcription factor bHLH131 [Argentina anserina]|uniref:transcription factor bHLH131 n=1 Tax=Argentina anserina TaxID=57926 RepID=UPI0021767A31|nr:transcription factor bHLH131 [Potentilla anserina]